MSALTILKLRKYGFKTLPVVLEMLLTDGILVLVVKSPIQGRNEANLFGQSTPDFLIRENVSLVLLYQLVERDVEVLQMLVEATGYNLNHEP